MAVCALLVVLGGCGDGSVATSDDGAERLPRLVGEVERVLEARRGPGDRVPARISGATVDPDGRIVVTDAGVDEVRVLSPEGDLVLRLTAGGPEADARRLSRPCCPAIGPEGRVWIRDGGNARYLGFRLDEDGAREWTAVPMAHDESELEAPITFDPEGRLIDVGREVDAATGRESVVRSHLGPDGTVAAREEIPPPPADSLGVHSVEGSLARAWVHPPFGPVQLVGHSPTGAWAEALSSRYRVRWHRPAGAAIEVGREGVRGPPVTEAERRGAGQRLSRLLGSLGEADTSVSVPERKPPLDELVFDRDGRLWVSLLVPEDAPRRADVWGADGRRLMVAEWPAGIALIRDHVSASGALGIARDADGERLVWIRFRAEDPDPAGAPGPAGAPAPG